VDESEHVERLAGNNKVLYKSVILLELFLELIHDARNDEHKSEIELLKISEDNLYMD
jgi:hypothetical protein